MSEFALIALTLVSTTQLPQATPALELLDRLPVSLEVYFGAVSDADVQVDGRTAVLDGIGQEVLIFDADGHLLTVLGGKGQGPGELLGATELEFGPGGEVAVVDGRNQRITMWDMQGGVLGTYAFYDFMPSGSMWTTDFSWTAAGAFLKTISFLPDEPVRVIRLPPTLDQMGEIVVEFREGDRDAMSCSFCSTLVDGAGRVLAAASDTLYRVLELDPHGMATATWGRNDLPATRRSEEELARLNQAARGRGAAEGGSGRPSFSSFRPRLGRGSIAVDSLGRLWTLPSQPDEVGTLLDVFDVDRALIGSIRVAEELQEIRIRHGYLLGIGETEIGEPVVFRYRLVG